MSIRISNEDAGVFKIGSEKVSILKSGSEILFRAMAVPIVPGVGTLYMIGNRKNEAGQEEEALYAVDRTTGMALRIGEAVNFGLSSAVHSYTGLAYDGTTLYMLGIGGAGIAALYTVSTTTGVATRVGNSTSFGVLESLPSALAWDGRDLYMTGRFNESGRLYRVNRATGVATKVGTQTSFGIRETTPLGLAWDGTNLYMVGRSGNKLYTVNRTTGRATGVGLAHQFGVTEQAVNGLAYDGQDMWMLGQYHDELYKLNKDTGVATRINADTVSQFGVFIDLPYNLAWAPGRVVDVTDPPTYPDGRLLMIGNANKVLYEVDVFHGSATRIGTATNFGVSELSQGVGGLALHKGKVYLLGLKSLYTLNLTTGVATKVGSATEFGVSETLAEGIASDGTNLYMTGNLTNALYTLNTTTGVATRVGSANRFGASENFPSGLAYNADTSTMYMSGADNEILYTLNLTTGVASQLGSLTAFGVGERSPSCIAFVNGELFMAGTSNEELYKVNITTTGRARPIGNGRTSFEFGVSEDSPAGMTWLPTPATIDSFTTSDATAETGASVTLTWTTSHADSVELDGNVVTADGSQVIMENDAGAQTYTLVAKRFGYEDVTQTVTVTWSAPVTGTLYLFDFNSLYTLNETTAAATRVAARPTRGIHGATYDGTNLYVTPDSSGTKGLYTIDLSSYAATLVRNRRWFVNIDPQGLEWDGTNLYMVDDVSNALHLVDRTGVRISPTRVGSATNFGVNETTPVGLAWDGTNMYMLGDSTNALYTINRTTGVATRVGRTTDFGVTGYDTCRGIAWNGSVLYAILSTYDRATEVETYRLYTLNRTTGVATEVGAIGTGPTYQPHALAYVPPSA